MSRNIIINILLLFIYFIISNTYLFNMKIADEFYNIKKYPNTDELYLNLNPSLRLIPRKKRNIYKLNINSPIHHNNTMNKVIINNTNII